MYKDCYRLAGDLAGIFRRMMDDYHDCVATFTDAAHYMARWCVENEFELRHYGIPEEDVPESERVATVAKGGMTMFEAKGKYGLDLNELIMPPAKKPALDSNPSDRCPEDTLREEIETKG